MRPVQVLPPNQGPILLPMLLEMACSHSSSCPDYLTSHLDSVPAIPFLNGKSHQTNAVGRQLEERFPPGNIIALAYLEVALGCRMCLRTLFDCEKLGVRYHCTLLPFSALSVLPPPISLQMIPRLATPRRSFLPALHSPSVLKPVGESGKEPPEQVCGKILPSLDLLVFI